MCEFNLTGSHFGGLHGFRCTKVVCDTKCAVVGGAQDQVEKHCSKASASYSVLCRAVACYSRSQIFTDHVKRGAFNASTFSANASCVEPGLYSPCQHEREGARSGLSVQRFGFQTKVKDRFLNQKR